MIHNPYNFAIYNWHVEISSKCTLKCPRCLRTMHPQSYKPKQIGLDFVQKVFSPKVMSQVMRVTFAGNLGDPIYNTELIPIVKYLKSQNPSFQLVIVTNGSYKSQLWWQELSKYLTPFDEIIFSIDGWNQNSNEQYRVNSDWNSIMLGLREMVKSKACVRWSTIIFKYNSQSIEKIKNIAKNLGVDSFHITLSERFGTHNKAYLNSEGIDPLEPDSKFISPYLRTKRFKHKFKTKKWSAMFKFWKTFDPIYNQKYLQTKQMYKNCDILPACLHGYRGIYIDCDGLFFPCCWTGYHYEEQTNGLTYGVFEPYLDELNLYKNSLESVLSHNIWHWLKVGWKKKGQAYVICKNKCHNSYSENNPEFIANK